MRLTLLALVPFAVIACKEISGDHASTDAGDASAAAADGAAAVAPSAGLAGQTAASPATPATPPPTYTLYSGRTAKNGTFVLALERSGKDVRAIYSGADAALAGKMTDDSHFSLREIRAGKGEKPATLIGDMTATSAKGTFTDAGKAEAFASSGHDAFDAKAPDFAAEQYLGKLGKSFVRAKLTKKGTSLSGVYRYASSQTDLSLDGTVQADGSFDLTEKAGAKVTGKIAGVLAGKGRILAQWSSADGARTLPVSLEHGDGYPETASYDNGVTIFAQEKVIEGKRCRADRLFPQMKSAGDVKAVAALNTFLREDAGTSATCEGPDDATLPDYEESSGYELGTHGGRFVGLSRNGYSFTGGAHGMYGSYCDVIDTKTLGHFKLASLLTPAGMTKLADMTSKDFLKQYSVTKLTDVPFNDDKITITKDTNLCLHDGEVEVSFTPYEVAPWSVGAPSAKFPKASVKNLFVANDVTAVIFK